MTRFFVCTLTLQVSNVKLSENFSVERTFFLQLGVENLLCFLRLKVFILLNFLLFRQDSRKFEDFHFTQFFTL